MSKALVPSICTKRHADEKLSRENKLGRNGTFTTQINQAVQHAHPLVVRVKRPKHPTTMALYRSGELRDTSQRQTRLIGNKLMTKYLIALLIALGLSAYVPIAHAKRIALVIGNDGYLHTTKLVNARNDATSMAQALQAVGFTVTRHLDLNRQDLFRAVDAFAMSVRKDDEVVFYYSGHGVQIESAPYLLPIDIQATGTRQIERDALSLNALVNDLSAARYSLVIVDACRNNPFVETGKRSIGAERGLAPIEPPEGSAIVMSAGRGQTALDSLGTNDREKNGLFVREFMRHMRTPGLQVRDLLQKVRDDVEIKAASVNHKQRPAFFDESRGQFFFVPPKASASVSFPVPPATATSAAPAQGAELTVELAFWDSIKSSISPDDFEAYLRQFPQGRFIDLAKARRDRLVLALKAPVPVAAARTEPLNQAQAQTEPTKTTSVESSDKTQDQRLYGKSKTTEVELPLSGSYYDVLLLREKRDDGSILIYRCGLFNRLAVSDSLQIEAQECHLASGASNSATLTRFIKISGQANTISIAKGSGSNPPGIIGGEKMLLIRSDLKPVYDQMVKSRPGLTTEEFLKRTTTASK